MEKQENGLGTDVRQRKCRGVQRMHRNAQSKSSEGGHETAALAGQHRE